MPSKEQIHDLIEKGASMSAAAKILGITRERVGQIYGRGTPKQRRKMSGDFIVNQEETFRENIERAKTEIISPLLEIVKEKIRKEHHAYEKYYPVTLGESAEKLAHNKFVSLGMNSALMPYGHPFDILVNGKKVDVKASQSKFCGNKKYSATYWHFAIRKDQKDTCDIFCCMADGKIWIIPSKDLGKVNSIYIPTGDSDRQWKKSGRWNKYINRFDLLAVNRPCVP